MAEKEIADRTAAWRAVLQAQDAALRAIERDLDAAGKVPLHWYDVLLELNGAPDRRLRIQELAGRIVLTRTRVSRLVDRLAAAGLVQRQPDSEDGRASFAAITPQGHRALRDAAPVYLAGIERHFTRYLSDEQVRAVAGALRQVVSAHRSPRVLRQREPRPDENLGVDELSEHQYDTAAVSDSQAVGMSPPDGRRR